MNSYREEMEFMRRPALGPSADALILGGGPPRREQTRPALSSVPFAPTGGWDTRADDVHALNALIHRLEEGEEAVLPSGVRLRRQSRSGYEALHLVDPDGVTRTTYPAGMTVHAAAGTLAVHHDLPGAPLHLKGSLADVTADEASVAEPELGL